MKAGQYDILPYDGNEDGLEFGQYDEDGAFQILGKLQYYGPDDANAERDMTKAEEIIQACNHFAAVGRVLRQALAIMEHTGGCMDTCQLAREVLCDAGLLDLDERRAPRRIQDIQGQAWDWLDR